MLNSNEIYRKLFKAVNKQRRRNDFATPNTAHGKAQKSKQNSVEKKQISSSKMTDSTAVAGSYMSWEGLCSYYLSNHLYESARFYAERLYYEKPDPYSLFILAECYYRLGKVQQTYMILQESVLLIGKEAQFLFATVCLSLGKLEEAESVLLTNGILPQLDQITATTMVNIPGGASGVYLLGKICKRQQRAEYAKRYFRVALQMDPFLWEAIMDLNELGLDVPIDSVLNLTQTRPTLPKRNHKTSEPKPSEALKSPPPTSQVHITSVQRSYSAVEQLSVREDGTPRMSVALGLSTMSLHPSYTPSPSPITTSMLQMTTHNQKKDIRKSLFGPTPSTLSQQAPVLPGDPLKRRVSFGPNARLSFSGAWEGVDPHEGSLYSPIYEQEGSMNFSHLPESSSRFPLSSPIAEEGEGESFLAPTPAPTESKAAYVEQEEEAEERTIGEVVLIYAKALQHLFNYQPLECIEALAPLPTKHYRSAYTCQLLGKAYIDGNDYKAAIVAYRQMLSYEPYRMQGVDYFSTALWHMKREKELASLAHNSHSVDKYSAECWLVLGNLFSLLRDTDLAIKYFTRAISLSPNTSYGYTLAGYEYIHNDNLELATQHFHTALLHNPRHYNAYYGLGSIAYKQEKYEVAEYYFKKARSMNSRSSVLDCYYAMALGCQGSLEKNTEAIAVLNEAIERDQNNPQLRFQKAHILMTQSQAEEALEELLLVESLAPQEPPVHGLLGQVYHHLGRTQEALKHLNIAMDLDPKEANALKAIIDSFEEPPMAS